ncbi:type 1 glutamine amidotransferase [Aspergillus tanneri]|nr:uncharacterized protein ATNIH1004_005500 [Aspergillus tanneri]KAA8646825.1 hypothetical protein ATNIH1004_005500 [Aspergillus tanneri]
MIRNIRIAVLNVDIPARSLYEARGLCSAHFRHVLQEAAAVLNENTGTSVNISITPYDVRGGHYPEFAKLRSKVEDDPCDNCTIDAILITGGSPGVYEIDQSPWMQTLEKFLKTVFQQYPLVRILGTCFGHQMIAHALMRDTKDPERDVFVEKCPLGMEVGVHTVRLESDFVRFFPLTLGNLPHNELRIQMFHGDRVLAVPKERSSKLTDASMSLPAPWVNVGSTPACPIQGLYYPQRVLSVQGHYELDAFGVRSMCLEFAPSMKWSDSKLAIFLEQVGFDADAPPDNAKAFALTVVCFLAGLENL